MHLGRTSEQQLGVLSWSTDVGAICVEMGGWVGPCRGTGGREEEM
jgi:hypothetical protein